MTEQSSSRIFTERSGVGIAEDIEVLLYPPERPLNPEDQIAVKQFSTDLLNGQYGDLQTGINIPLTEVNKRPALRDQYTFYPDYFTDSSSPAGAEQLYLAGFQGDLTNEAVKKFLASDPKFQSLKKSDIKGLATKSLQYTKNVMANHIMVDPEGQTDFIYREWDAITVHYKPEELIDTFRDILAFREFYRGVSASLNVTSGDLADAKKFVLNMHKAKINEMLADYYPALANLIRQLPYMEAEDAKVLEEEIKSLSPVIERFTRNPQQALEQRYMRRLDYLRNGVVVKNSEEGSSMSVLSNDLLGMFDESETAENAELPNAVFNTDQLEKMDATIWKSLEIAKLFSEVLRTWDLLSSEPSTLEDITLRSGPPSDKKFQVVINPNIESLDVDAKKYVVNVPAGFERNLTHSTPPVGVLPAVAHELEHVIQCVVDMQLAETIPLAAIKGKHALTGREAGSLLQEDIMQSQYFGRRRAVNPHYLRALQIKLSGGNRMQASRAFYMSKVITEGIAAGDESSYKKAAKEAVDRTRRLYRKNGYDTQPLDYAEQGLLVKELKKLALEHAKHIIAVTGSFAIKDIVGLHRFGLVPNISLSFDPVVDTINVYNEKFTNVGYTNIK